MLRSLSIRDFVIVDRMDLEFASGFTVLSGETGAGKSILIDALALALGARADTLVVRQGRDRAEVSAEFDVREVPACARWLETQELADEGGVCLMRRVVDASGRSRAFINGRAATLAQLRAAGEFLIEIHGQHQHHSLGQAAIQRELLDAYGQCTAEARNVAEGYREWQRCRERRLAAETDAARLAAERETLSWQVQDMEALDLSADAWSGLVAEHSRLANATSLVEAAHHALEGLTEAEDSALDRLSAVMSRLANVVEYDACVKEILSLLEPARIQLQEACSALRRYGEGLEADPQRLRAIEQRIEAVHGVARKFRTSPEALPELLERLRERLSELDRSADPEALRTLEQAAETEYLAGAKKLTAARRKAARNLSEEVSAAMQTLAMAGGKFEVALEAAEPPAAYGLEEVSFLVSAHKGMAPQPIARIASGGELSRISLALQTAASRVARVPTLIFDEVDAGIGGRVAEIVGRMLKALGRHHQVLCITHLPQVAASADQQWQVHKATANGKVSSGVTVLDPAQRVEEIARMLGGVTITETTRRHAAEMLGVKG